MAARRASLEAVPFTSTCFLATSMFTSSTPEQNQSELASLAPTPSARHSEGGVRTRNLAHERAHSLGAALAGHRNLEFVLRNKINQKHQSIPLTKGLGAT
jgi:hypothetical protein